MVPYESLLLTWPLEQWVGDGRASTGILHVTA